MRPFFANMVAPACAILQDMPYQPEIPAHFAGFNAAQQPEMRSLHDAVRFNSRARTVFLDPGACGVSGGSAKGVAGNFSNIVSLPDAATTYAIWNFQMPLGFAGLPIRVRVFWSQSGANTGNFRVALYGAIWLAPGADLITAASTATGGIFSLKILPATGVANDPQVSTYLATAPTPATILDQEHFCGIRMQRQGAHATDTCVDAYQISGVEITPYD